MKNLNKNLLSFLIMIPLFFISCSDDDELIPVSIELNSKTYALGTVGDFGVSGTAKFIKNNDATLSIELDLQNTPAGGVHPAHIHFNTAAEGGGIALSLEAVNGDTGKSTTTFSALDDGTAITYQELLDFDGYINVHLSATELSTLVVQGDIGQNELTDVSKAYALGSVAVPGIDGTTTFYERVNGEALAVIQLNNTPVGGEHPGHIHMNTATQGGGVVFTFNPVNGDTGMSKTNVAALNDGTAFGYSDVLGYNGYINIHLSAADLATLVAQGNIGSNEGIAGPESKTYDVTNSGSSAYVFNGEGLSNSNNPDFTFRRGSTYTFNVNTPGHPFYINTVQGTGTANAYNSGVVNNGAESGTIMFTVPMDAPNTLYYNCEFHASMTGTISVTD